MNSKTKLVIAVPALKISWHHVLIEAISQIPNVEIDIVQINKNSTFRRSLLHKIHFWLDGLLSDRRKPTKWRLTPIQKISQCDYLLNLCENSDSELKIYISTGTINIRHTNQISQYYSPGIWEFAQAIFELKINLTFTPSEKKTPLTFTSSTKTDQLSLRKNEDKFCARAALLLFRLMFDRSSLSSLQTTQKHTLTPINKHKLSSQALKFHWKAIRENIGEKLLFKDGWYIHLNDTNTNRGISLTSPKDRFWADPFPLTNQGQNFIFVEEWIHKAPHAHLGVLELTDDLQVHKNYPVLELGHHLSYPFVFVHEDQIFMIPETRENQTISLYRCDRFPDKWTLEQVLMKDVKAVDTTLLWHDDKWWMFTNIDDFDGESAINDELYIFYSDNLKSESWTPHPNNPVKSSCIGSRSAGRIYLEKRKLYRPAQDCSRRYGYGILIYEITILTTIEFEEQLVKEIYPDPKKGDLRTHTLNMIDGLVVSDRYKHVK